MSTHCAVGVVAGGKLTGRYVHSDGYPTHSGLAVAKMIARDGANTAVAKLLNSDWYFLAADLPELDGPTQKRLDDVRAAYPAKYPADDPIRHWLLAEGPGKGVYIGVPGYGIADPDSSAVTLTLEANNDREWDVRWGYGVDHAASELVVVHAVLKPEHKHTVVSRLSIDGLPLEQEAWQAIENECEGRCS